MQRVQQEGRKKVLGIEHGIIFGGGFVAQANDFEAYQELLREQGGDESQGERYEVITKFLNDTEEYLNKLASKVSNVKLQQEASEAFTKATAEARAMVDPPPPLPWRGVQIGGLFP